MAQSIFTNTLIASGGRVVNAVLGVIALGLISRFLGTAHFGAFIALITIGTIVQIIADAGLYLTLTRSLAQQPDQAKHLISHTISLRLALLIIGFVLSGLIINLIPALRGLTLVYSVAALGFIAQSISQLLMGVYQKHSVVWRATIGDLAGRLAQVAGIALLGAAGASLLTMASFFTLSTIIALLIHWLLLPVKLQLKPVFVWPVWQRLLITAAPLAALLILNVVHFRIDTIFLTLLRSPEEVGLYGIAFRLIESTLFFPAMFGGLLLPHLAAAFDQSKLKQLQRYITDGLFAVIWAALIITLSLLFLARPIIDLIAGADFVSAATPLRILALALVPLFIGNVAGFTIVAGGSGKSLVALAAFTTTLNIVLNLMLIPTYGVQAAAWTTLVTEVIAALGAVGIASRLVPFKLAGGLLWRLTLTTVATGVLYYLLPANWPLLLSLFLGVATYTVISYLLKLIAKDRLASLLTTP